MFKLAAHVKNDAHVRVCDICENRDGGVEAAAHGRCYHKPTVADDGDAQAAPGSGAHDRDDVILTCVIISIDRCLLPPTPSKE